MTGAVTEDATPAATQNARALSRSMSAAAVVTAITATMTMLKMSGRTALRCGATRQPDGCQSQATHLGKMRADEQA